MLKMGATYRKQKTSPISVGAGMLQSWSRHPPAARHSTKSSNSSMRSSIQPGLGSATNRSYFR